VRATTTVAIPEGAAMVDALCPRLERAGSTARAARCWVEAADLHDALGELDRARDAIDRALAIAPDGRHETWEARAYDELWHDRPASAALRLVLEILWMPLEADAPWFRRFARAKLELALGRAQLALGDRGGASATLARVVAELEPIVRDHPQQMFERRLARARAELATAGSR
jgi:hypothetical protein